MIEVAVFCSMAAVALVSAVLVVTLRNTVHCALFLGLSLAGVAGVFGTLAADFLFVSQILIYVGGIAVLMIFAVMLMGRTSDLTLRQVNQEWLAGLLVCAITAAGLLRQAKGFLGKAADAPARALAAQAATKPLGRLMLGDFAVPFELISLVLMAALLGAIFFTRKEDEPKSTENGKPGRGGGT
ncbi:MAG: NADH-quinone oxidoreductase subunit J [Elusimicrobia bacterium]|nr:NADH-quinone oxidoreductase subunit J [Elusimicrobiota bacterium]